MCVCVCMFSGSSAPRLNEFLSSFQAKVSSPRNNPLPTWPLHKQKHTHAENRAYIIQRITIFQVCPGSFVWEMKVGKNTVPDNVVIWNVGNGDWKLQWSHLILISLFNTFPLSDFRCTCQILYTCGIKSFNIAFLPHIFLPLLHHYDDWYW